MSPLGRTISTVLILRNLGNLRLNGDLLRKALQMLDNKQLVPKKGFHGTALSLFSTIM
jgi:hypothetical protein